MVKEFKKKVQFHPKKTLTPQNVVKGVMMWSVALEKTMFTYFEIDPNSRFDLHSHISEQITMVLEGELFFKIEDRTISVKKGEVIAIPSNTPHEAFTKNISVIAVDAWSPVMEKYRRKVKNKGALENRSIRTDRIGTKP